MKIGDRVKLLNNIYHSPEGDDGLMAPGTNGVIQHIESTYVTVILEHEVEGKRDWSFLPTEIEVIA